MTALLVVLPAGPASAAVAVSASLTMPAAAAVGQTGLAGSFTVVNTNTAPNQGQSDTLTQLRPAPACGSPGVVGNTCPTPDQNVFGLAPTATGRAGTACAGRTFSVAPPDAAGVFTFTPSSPVVLAPPGGTPGSDRCTVDFTFAVGRMPTIDANPSAPGIQTHTNLSAQATGGGLTVTAQPSLQVTVVRATPTLTSQASPSVRVGEAISDQATVIGAPDAAPPTGTVTFRAFGPKRRHLLRSGVRPGDQPARQWQRDLGPVPGHAARRLPLGGELQR